MRNVHKLNLVAASVAMAVSGGVNAGQLGAANEIIIGGATAPQNFLREDLMLRICDANAAPVQVFVDNVAVNPDPVPGGNILSQGDHFVVRCAAENTFNAPLAAADIAVYKLNGGSATGVAPVSDPDGADPNDIGYLDTFISADLTGDDGGCVPWTEGANGTTGGGPLQNEFPIGTSGGVYELYECPNPALIVTQVPDAGISDVEPTLFTGSLALDFGNEPYGVNAKPTQPFVAQGNLNIKPGPGLIFGTAVSLPMYDEMSRDQYAAGLLPECDALIGDGDPLTPPTTAEWDGDVALNGRDNIDTVACMPSMPSAAIRSVFTGQVTSWADLAPYGETLDPTAVFEGDNVHICKRTNGSGTHAQFSVHFMGTNCVASSNISMLEVNDGIAFAPADFVGVYANRGSSDMSDCVDALGNGAGFNGDFAGLPQSLFWNTGDSSVVPGTGLAVFWDNDGDPLTPPVPQPLPVVVETSGGPHPLGLTYRNGGTPFTAYGMGYNSTENNTALTFDYRFIKVDFAAPTLEEAVAGNYSDIYYLSYQHRSPGGGVTPDLRTGDIRTAPATANQIAVAEEYFKVWNATAPAAIKAVNDGLVVDPDGVAGNGDEWQGGYLSAIAGAEFKYNGTDPATPWSRQNETGGADSCQELGLVRNPG